MPSYEFTGFDSRGHKVTGSIEASGRRAAIAQLRRDGTFVTALHEAGRRVRSRWAIPWRRGLPTDELALASRQLATLLGAGLSLDEALASTAHQQTDRRLRDALTATRQEVLQGESLHRALAQRGGLFPDFFISMVEVGETGGHLDKILERLADFLEERARMQSRLASALAYPLLMLLVGCGVLFFLVTYVLPNVTRMLTELEIPLPLSTRLLIGVSSLLHDYGLLWLLLLGILLIVLRNRLDTEKGRLHLDRLKLRLPLVGSLNLHLASARFARTAALLLEAGLPLLRTLDLAGRLTGNRVLTSAVDAAADRVREGESLAEALRRQQIFPELVPQMIAIGERSGALQDMLARLADSYERQLETRLGRLLALLEPAMILVMGLAVGFIVLAILLPIFEASQGLG
ncbi:MAG: type II secretion system F family protein [Geothermobacteraceae bacterium]